MSRLRVLFVGDTHFGAADRILPARPGGWLTAQLQVFEQALQYCVRHRIRHCVHLGDVTDDPYPPQATVVALAQLLRRYPRVEVHFNLGNHDYQDSTTDSTIALAEFATHQDLHHVHVYRRRAVVQLEGIPVIFLPWPEQHPAREDPRGAVVVAHCDAVGAVYDNGRPVERGSGVQLRRDGNLWVIGHIHKRQQVRQAHFVGTPMQNGSNPYGESTEKFFSDVRFRRHRGALRGRITAVPVRLPYLLHNLAVDKFDGLRLNPPPHYYRITLAPEIHFPAGWLEQHPQVLRHSSQTRKTTAAADTGNASEHLSELADQRQRLRGYLLQQGWSRPQARAAWQLLKQVVGGASADRK